jgi:hypothetical protein
VGDGDQGNAQREPLVLTRAIILLRTSSNWSELSRKETR